jgi:hypothetical protein
MLLHLMCNAVNTRTRAAKMVSQEVIAPEPISLPPPIRKLFCSRRRNRCASIAAAGTGSKPARMPLMMMPVRCSRGESFLDLALGPASALPPGQMPAAAAAAYGRCPAARPSPTHLSPSRSQARERNVMARDVLLPRTVVLTAGPAPGRTKYLRHECMMAYNRQQ